MFGSQPLILEYRGELVENVHSGYLCVVDEHSQVVFSAGDPETYIYYRSASKPIQALPVIARRLDEKYRLSDEETVIFAGSHAAENFHVAALESILRKTGLAEEDLIVKPTLPHSPRTREAALCAGAAPRKLYHNCSGKHIACMLLQRELGGDVPDYWRMDSPAQREILRAMAVFSEMDPANVKLGVDGCGVPVFAVPVRSFAAAYKNLACVDTLADEDLREAARRYVPRIHAHSRMMRETGTLCTLINDDENLIGKGGAAGAYGCGLKAQRLGMAIKVQDGSEAAWPLLLKGLFEKAGYHNADTFAMLDAQNSGVILNNNDTEVGYSKLIF